MSEAPSPDLALPDGARCVVLACNPLAGGFSATKLDGLRTRLEREGHVVRIEDSLSFRIASAADAAHLTCMIGGDGTARTVIARNRDLAHGATFCIFPTGTVNLLAREAGYRSDAGALVRRWAQGPRRQHYFGELNGEPFLCCASVGIDSMVVERVTARAKRRFGRLAYVLALRGLLRRWPRPRLTVTVDGEAVAGEAAFVCKGRYYAGPWVIDRAADLRADEFRVLVLPLARRRDVARLLFSAVLGGRFGAPAWRRMAGREVAIVADGALPVQADGDVVATTPVLLRVAPEPLRFL